MGEVVGAGFLSHVPTIMLPLETRLELNQGKEISLVPALHRIRAEKFEQLDYDTVIVLDSHWFTTVEFIISSQALRAGLFTAEELPRGMCHPALMPGDCKLISHFPMKIQHQIGVFSSLSEIASKECQPG